MRQSLLVLTSILIAAMPAGLVALSPPTTDSAPEQAQAEVPPVGSPQAGRFDAAVAVQMLVIGLLVVVLLAGGFLVVNLGLMSKRPQDQTGHRDPSDLGFMEGNVWPEGKIHERILPADEDESAKERIAESPREGRPPGSGKNAA